MTTSRDRFLESIRKALGTGNRAGLSAEIRPRGEVGYQGAGADPVARFRDECLAAGGHPHVVADAGAAVAQIIDLIRECQASRIVLGTGWLIDTLNLARGLDGLGVDIRTVASLSADANRDAVFDADIGITGVHYLIAETGTVVMSAAPEEPRSLSLLPPVHIAVAHRSQIVPDLFDLFESGMEPISGALPSCVSLITGPSKTGDIELRLVTGVHGPGTVHVIVMR
jgi:L-lactate dehydrogenase complex protein LldG